MVTVGVLHDVEPRREGIIINHNKATHPEKIIQQRCVRNGIIAISRVDL
jgi:hypothetical protein